MQMSFFCNGKKLIESKNLHIFVKNIKPNYQV